MLSRGKNIETEAKYQHKTYDLLHFEEINIKKRYQKNIVLIFFCNFEVGFEFIFM